MTQNNLMQSTMDFDWTPYEDGWNGRSLRKNTKVRIKNKKDKVYSHETYAIPLFRKFMGVKELPVSKELRRDILVSINDIKPISSSIALASINGGSNNVVIDLNKESKFFNTLNVDGHAMTKDDFIACLNDDDMKKVILDMNLVARIGTDIEKASIWDGYVESFSNELREQVYRKNKAYMAKILSSTNGGFVVEVANTIKAFMPGSMASANKLNDYESLVGKEMEVMVESYDPKFGFVVSRKKYIRTIVPLYTKQLAERVAKQPDLIIHGTVTGTTPFGIFVELDDHLLTGMLHKTLISDTLREALRNNEIKPDTAIDVYVHKIENGRIILSDVPTVDRDAVIAKREEEDAREKLEYIQAKKDAEESKTKESAENTVDTPVSEVSQE